MTLPVATLSNTAVSLCGGIPGGGWFVVLSSSHIEKKGGERLIFLLLSSTTAAASKSVTIPKAEGEGGLYVRGVV